MGDTRVTERTGFAIEKADLRDAIELTSLVNSAYRGESSRAGWTTEADLLDGSRISEPALTALLQNPAVTILKIVQMDSDASPIVGCVELQLQKECIYLGMLTVQPKLQGGGLGKQLLQAAEKFAREYSVPILRMTVISVRKELIEWYKRHGYQPTGKRQEFPNNDPCFGQPRFPLEMIVLEKRI
jgi:ribosomal protein S18 acetylase RimI-like enzyme